LIGEGEMETSRFKNLLARARDSCINAYTADLFKTITKFGIAEALGLDLQQ
jgi:hypothetical protein